MAELIDLVDSSDSEDGSRGLRRDIPISSANADLDISGEFLEPGTNSAMENPIDEFARSGVLAQKDPEPPEEIFEDCNPGVLLMDHTGTHDGDSTENQSALLSSSYLSAESVVTKPNITLEGEFANSPITDSSSDDHRSTPRVAADDENAPEDAEDENAEGGNDSEIEEVEDEDADDEQSEDDADENAGGGEDHSFSDAEREAEGDSRSARFSPEDSKSRDSGEDEEEEQEDEEVMEVEADSLLEAAGDSGVEDEGAEEQENEHNARVDDNDDAEEQSLDQRDTSGDPEAEEEEQRSNDDSPRERAGGMGACDENGSRQGAEEEEQRSDDDENGSFQADQSHDPYFDNPPPCDGPSQDPRTFDDYEPPAPPRALQRDLRRRLQELSRDSDSDASPIPPGGDDEDSSVDVLEDAVADEDGHDDSTMELRLEAGGDTDEEEEDEPGAKEDDQATIILSSSDDSDAEAPCASSKPNLRREFRSAPGGTKAAKKSRDAAGPSKKSMSYAEFMASLDESKPKAIDPADFENLTWPPDVSDEEKERLKKQAVSVPTFKVPEADLKKHLSAGDFKKFKAAQNPVCLLCEMEIEPAKDQTMKDALFDHALRVHNDPRPGLTVYRYTCKTDNCSAKFGTWEEFDQHCEDAHPDDAQKFADDSHKGWSPLWALFKKCFAARSLPLGLSIPKPVRIAGGGADHQAAASLLSPAATISGGGGKFEKLQDSTEISRQRLSGKKSVGRPKKGLLSVPPGGDLDEEEEEEIKRVRLNSLKLPEARDSTDINRSRLSSKKFEALPDSKQITRKRTTSKNKSASFESPSVAFPPVRNFRSFGASGGAAGTSAGFRPARVSASVHSKDGSVGTPVKDHEGDETDEEEEKTAQPEGVDASPEGHPELEVGEEAMEDDAEEAAEDGSDVEVEVTPEARGRGGKRGGAAATDKFAAFKAALAKKKSSARAKEEKEKAAASESNSDDDEKESGGGSSRRTTRTAFAALPSPVRSPAGRPAPGAKKMGKDVAKTASSKKQPGKAQPSSATIVTLKAEKKEKEAPKKVITKRPASPPNPRVATKAQAEPAKKIAKVEVKSQKPKVEVKVEKKVVETAGAGIALRTRRHVTISVSQSESVVKKSKQRAESPKEKQREMVASTTRSGKRARPEEDAQADESSVEGKKSKGVGSRPGGTGAATGTEIGRIVTRNKRNRTEKEEEGTRNSSELKPTITKKESKGEEPGGTGAATSEAGPRITRNKRERKEESKATIEEAKGAGSSSRAKPRPEDEMKPMSISLRNILSKEALAALGGKQETSGKRTRGVANLEEAEDASLPKRRQLRGGMAASVTTKASTMNGADATKASTSKANTAKRAEDVKVDLDLSELDFAYKGKSGKIVVKHQDKTVTLDPDI